MVTETDKKEMGIRRTVYTILAFLIVMVLGLTSSFYIYMDLTWTVHETHAEAVYHIASVAGMISLLLLCICMADDNRKSAAKAMTAGIAVAACVFTLQLWRLQEGMEFFFSNDDMLREYVVPPTDPRFDPNHLRSKQLERYARHEK